MVERRVEYAVRLGVRDRYRHLHIRRGRRIVYFRVQYETLVGCDWQVVVRYDTAHGFAHRDLVTKDGNIIKTPLFIVDYKEALIFAESDLKANWEIYKERFLRG